MRVQERERERSGRDGGKERSEIEEKILIEKYLILPMSFKVHQSKMTQNEDTQIC